MPSRPRRLAVAALLAPLVFTACGDRSRASGKSAAFAARDSTRLFGPGDLQITSADTSLEVALVGDSVILGLGRKTLDEIRRSTDTTRVEGNGFGASIEKFVKSKVSDALAHQVLIPVSNIETVRYEDGRLQIIGTGGNRIRLFDNSRRGRTNGSELFNADDAHRFISAFEARKAAPSGR